MARVLPPIFFFGGKYDLIKLYRQLIHISKLLVIHKKLLKLSPNIIYLKKKKNENNMVAHAICFDFCLAV